jgi:hypothetical protein
MITTNIFRTTDEERLFFSKFCLEHHSFERNDISNSFLWQTLFGKKPLEQL